MPIPKMGPEPVLLSRKEVDALYETLGAVATALETLDVEYIVTGGSLLGAIRQHSILFCDDDIDIAIIDVDGSVYNDKVVRHLQQTLSKDYTYQVRPWEGGDRIRPKRMSNVFLDLFVLRKYNSLEELREVIGVKKNGQPQSDDYVNGIITKMQDCAISQNESASLCPFWHFSTRKAIEMWTKEVYRESELFPLNSSLKMGPLDNIKGPRMPVLLLKRAFGLDCFEVYYQSASHKTQNSSNNNHHRTDNNDTDNSTKDLPPLTSVGGTWEGGQKAPLAEEHYLPMQPISRAARRNTFHCKEQLFEYLQEQSALETKWMNEMSSLSSSSPSLQERPNQTIYMDGVFDLFHIGHLEAIQNCAKLGNRVIIGVTGDFDATGYKRKPIVPQEERVAIIANLKWVDDVVCPCPLVVTEEFTTEKGIDLVVHGFANEQDAKRQEEFFEIPMRLGKFQRIPYYHGLSTTDRLQNIRQTNTTTEQPQENGKKPTKTHQQWFGSTVAATTENSATIPTDPFPLNLRIAIEPHIRKATKRRKEALSAIQMATGQHDYEAVFTTFQEQQGLAQEMDFPINTEDHKLRPALIESLGLPENYDLSSMHEEIDLKDRLLDTLTQNFASFQQVYDDFVRSVCVPQLLASSSKYDFDECYYQAFPCLRIVQPDEFSIGPHADVAYGHHPCSVNFYVPLTRIGGASSLFLESRLGSEDWHSIEGDYGMVKRFPGAICLHWTTDNKTDKTRVSLDFRLIPGPMFHALKCGSSCPGGQIDVYRRNEGYYSRCIKKQSTTGTSSWERDGPLIAPDARVGFPWTVKDWDKFWGKKKTKGG